MTHRRFRLLVALVVSAAALDVTAAGAESPLAGISSKLERQYPDLVQLTPEELGKRQADPAAAPVVIDARSPAEYAVSHIKGAIRIDANASPAAVVEAVGDVTGKSVVVYCTVGGRSSHLASAARAALLAKGARDVGNLKGGVLAWHNAGLPLVDEAGATELVHPSSPEGARLLDRPSLARMSPGTKTCANC